MQFLFKPHQPYAARNGGAPNMWLHSRLDWEGLSQPTWNAAVAPSRLSEIISRRASFNRSVFWYCSGLMAVGGGSTQDACKGIAASVKYDGPVSDLFVNESGLSDSNEAPSLATILTMAGTGSEINKGVIAELKRKIWTVPHTL